MRRLLFFAALLAALLWLVPLAAFAQSGPVPTIQLDATTLMLVGTFLPPLLALIIRSDWTPELKSLFALVVCAIVGAVIAYLQFGLNPANMGASALAVAVIARVLYDQFWKPLNIPTVIESGATGVSSAVSRIGQPPPAKV